MSREGVAMFLTRIMEDAGFRDQVKANPDATLAQFELTPEEVAAIKSADASKLQELGVDERVSKTMSPDSFVLDAAAMGATPTSATAWVNQLMGVLSKIYHP